MTVRADVVTVGAVGPAGAAGAPGATGATGATGPAGPQGDPGGVETTLLHGEKITWTNDTGDPVVEVWGEVAPEGLTLTYSDPFSTSDNYPDWLVVMGGNAKDVSWWTVAPGYVQPNQNTQMIRSDWPTVDDTSKVVVRGSIHSGAIGVGFYADDSHYMYASLGSSSYPHAVLQFLTANDGVTLHTTTESFSVPDYWMRLEMTRAGNIVHIKLVDETTNTVVYDAGYTLLLADQSSVGAGQMLKPLLRLNGYGTALQVDYFDVYTTQAESRDLYTTVYRPSDNTPITIRIFGIQGSTTRTDL